MIATTIGRTFLKAFNEKTGNNYTAKEFFEKEYIPVFYDHPLYMMSGGNSPLENPKISWKKGVRPSKEERKVRIIKTIDKIESSLVDASIAIGYQASDVKGYATTSGLISDIDISYSAADKYLSWIGSGFGCCVAGGISIYFKEIEFLWKIYEGWSVYRGILNDRTIEKIRGNQIEAWNAQWLSFSFNKRDFRTDFDFNYLMNISVFKIDKDGIGVDTVSWPQLLFALSKGVSKTDTVGYIYSLGQTNTTLGFYPFHFAKARKLIQYYELLFGKNAAINDAKEYEALFGIHIKRACEMGSIGLQALEPKNLRKYFGSHANLKLTKPDIKQKASETDDDFNTRKTKAYAKDNENIITYRTYKTWLLAMITKNKEESLEYTSEVAKALLAYREGAKKNDRKNLISNDLLGTKSKKIFIDALATVIKDADDNSLTVFKELRDRVHMMSAEDFGYFVVLLKFDYAYEERNS